MGIFFSRTKKDKEHNTTAITLDRSSSLSPDKEWKFKVGVVGEADVGKTSCLLRYVDNDFEEEEDKTTVGIDYRIKSLNVRGRGIKLQIVDTAGQERFRTITASFYRGVSVYDITDKESFNRRTDWLSEVRQYTRADTPVLLVGNKCDKAEHRKVPTSEGEEWAKKEGLLGFFETSAKVGTNINEAFGKLAEALVDQKMGT